MGKGRDMGKSRNMKEIKKNWVLAILIAGAMVMISISGCIETPLYDRVKEESNMGAYGTIKGKVNGENYTGYVSPVDNVTISIKNTSFTAITDSDGYYMIKNIPPSVYTITAGKKGYEPQIKNIAIASGEETTVDFHLYPEWWGNKTEVLILECEDYQTMINALEKGVWLSGMLFIPIEVPEGTHHLYATLDWNIIPEGTEGTALDLMLRWAGPDEIWHSISPDPCTPFNKPYTYNITVDQTGKWTLQILPDALEIPAGVCVLAHFYLKVVASRI